MFDQTQSIEQSNYLSANFRGLVLGRKEGRKEYSFSEVSKQASKQVRSVLFKIAVMLPSQMFNIDESLLNEEVEDEHPFRVSSSNFLGFSRKMHFHIEGRPPKCPA